MTSLSPSKRAVTVTGARGGSRTGRRSVLGSKPPFTSKSVLSSARCYTNKEHIDMTSPRSPGPGVFELGQFDTQPPMPDNDVEREVAYKTTSSPRNLSSSFIREQETVPVIIANSKTCRPRIQAPGAAQGISPLNIPPSDSRHHLANQHTDKNRITLQQALLQLSPSPPAGKNFFAKHLSGLKILDKSPKKFNESSSSTNDDLYIATDADATYKRLSPSANTYGNNTLSPIAKRTGDSGFRSSANSSPHSPAQSKFSEISPACEDVDIDVGGISAYQQSTLGSRQHTPQSSAASTRSAATIESTVSTTSSNSATTSISSTQSYPAMNRGLPKDHSDEESSDEDDSRPLKQPTEPASRFACPFRVHDPQKFNKGSCAFSSWESISRVKEHLYRCHIHICQRCFHDFKNQNELASHYAKAQGCKPGIWVAEGIKPEIVKKIKSRKKASDDKSEKGSWDAIYKLLFPGEDIPLPYFRAPQESPESLDSRTLTSIEEDLRRELPSLVRTSNDTRNLGEDALERLISSINDRISRVIAPYGINSGPLETTSNAPLTQPLSERQQGNVNTFGNQRLSDIRQANTVMTFSMPPQQQLRTDFPDQESSYLPMNVDKNYTEGFHVRDAMLYSYQAPYHGSGGIMPYSNSAVSKVGFQEMENQTPEYDHNMAQTPNNPHALHTGMSEETLMELDAWNQPGSRYDMDGVSIGGRMSYIGSNDFNGNVSRDKGEHQW